MKFEELIYERLSSDEALTAKLAKYGSYPAIFTPEAPDDEQDAWERKSRYPMIEYTYDTQANEERASSGTLSLFLKSLNTSEVEPQEIERLIKQCLRDVVLQPEDDSPYCLTWAQTDAFTMQDKEDQLILGADIRFDMIEMPPQQTTDPDPVDALNYFVKAVCPECIVIGYDRLEEITEPSKDRPVVFCRLDNTSKAEETFTVAWMDCRIAVHFLCPDASMRLKWTMQVANKLSIDGEVEMLDRSPMRITRLQVNHKADYLRQGQLMVSTHYGLLKYRADGKGVKGVQINY